MAVSILAVATLTVACTEQATTPRAVSIASRTLAAPTTAVLPSATVSPALPPSGRLVFVRDFEGVESPFTINPDGTDRKPLLAAGVSPRWSPDGSRISIVAGNRQGRVFVGVVEPDGSHYVQFSSPDPTLDLGCFAWSPDAARLACEGWDDTDPTRNGLYTVRASDGGGLDRVTTCPGGCHDIPTDYSPDGKHILFTRQKLPDEADVALMVVNVDGTGAHLMSDRRLGGGRWSPDGNTILVGANGSLLLVPIDGSPTRTLGIDPPANVRPSAGAWSPDGDWIVFSGQSPTGFDVYIVRTDGSSLRQVADTPRIWEGDPDWR